MINELIKLANHLDTKGYSKEADYIDSLVKRAHKNYKLTRMAQMRDLMGDMDRAFDEEPAPTSTPINYYPESQADIQRVIRLMNNEVNSLGPAPTEPRAFGAYQSNKNDIYAKYGLVSQNNNVYIFNLKDGTESRPVTYSN